MKQNNPYFAKISVLLVLLVSMATLVLGQSLKLNGTSQYGRAPHNAALQLQSFTIEFWLRPEGTGTVSTQGSGSNGLANVYPVLTKGRAETENAAVDVNYYSGISSSTNKIGFDFEDDATSENHPIYSATPLQSCVWQHVAATYDDVNGIWKIYINGVLDSSKALSQNFHPRSASTVNLSFGTGVNSTNVTDGFFNGSMDEIRIWNRVRTDAEILAGKNQQITSDPNLAARYSLNEGTGTTAANSSATGAAINAALTGAPLWNANNFDPSSVITSGSIDFDGANDYITMGSATGLNATNFTLEGWVRIEGTGTSTSTGTNGITGFPIITKGRGESETAGLNLNYFLGIDSSNFLVADFEEATGPNHPVVGNTALKANVWYHIAVTYGAGTWRLYINGVLDKSKTEAGSPSPEPNSGQHFSIGSALTSTGVSQGTFNGKIDEVRVWNVVRSATDISNNYLVELSSGSGLAGRWGFNECSGNSAINSVAGGATGTLTNAPTRTVANFNPAPSDPINPNPASGTINFPGNQVGITVNDRNAQNMTVTLYGRKKNAAAGTPFTIIGLPDTQFYTEEPQGANSSGGGHNGIFKSQTQWIANHRVDSNIVFVSQLGDCTQNGDTKEIEFKRADTAMKNIENPNVPTAFGIPYAISVGNHDQGPIYNPNGTSIFYNQYFGSARFAGRTYYGGHYGANNDNSYQLFSAGGIDFIHISLEYNDNSNAAGQGSTTDIETLQAVLDWADNLLKTYPNRKAILSTHWLMGTGTQTAFQGPGQKIYDDLKDNPNLILMLAGHVAGEGRRTDVFGGNTVHTLMSDYQSGFTNGGNGFLRIMRFDPATNTLSVKTYSPYANSSRTGASSEFQLPVSLGGASFTMINSQVNAASGSTVNLPWAGLEPLTEYEWYVTVSDGENEVTSQVFNFKTSGLVPIKLMEFKAVEENKQVKLSWKTATESNSQRFDVERSIDGSHFNKIGEVAAKGNSNSIQKYSLLDANASKGINYYRLKQLDVDGHFTYSPIVAVTLSSGKGFEIYPNPVSGNEISIVFSGEVKDKAVIKVFDLNGKLRINTTSIIDNSNISIKHNLTPGVYVVSVTVGDKEESKKVVVQ